VNQTHQPDRLDAALGARFSLPDIPAFGRGMTLGKPEIRRHIETW